MYLAQNAGCRPVTLQAVPRTRDALCRLSSWPDSFTVVTRFIVTRPAQLRLGSAAALLGRSRLPTRAGATRVPPAGVRTLQECDLETSPTSADGDE